MIDNVSEVQEAKPQAIPLFKDWSPYEAAKVSPQLPSNMRYTPPKPNDDLRRKIMPFENKLKDDEKTILGTSLSFLERGTLEDDFGKNDNERDKFHLSQTILIGGERITLYQLAKKVNKLSGNAISNMVFAGQIVGGQDLEKKSIELGEKIENIKKERGYFLKSDLGQVDDLALQIIEHILQQ